MKTDEMLEQARNRLGSMKVKDMEKLSNKYGYYPVRKGTDPEDTQYRIKICKIEDFEVIIPGEDVSTLEEAKDLAYDRVESWASHECITGYDTEISGVLEYTEEKLDENRRSY